MTKRAPSLSQTDVAAAGRQLLARGVDVTERALLEILGRGSLRTIHRHLADLRQAGLLPMSPHPTAWLKRRLDTACKERNELRSWVEQVQPILDANHLSYPSPPDDPTGIDTSDGDLPIVVLDDQDAQQWCTTDNRPHHPLHSKSQVLGASDCAMDTPARETSRPRQYRSANLAAHDHPAARGPRSHATSPAELHLVCGDPP